ncbi:hypothetical protein CA946_03520 [Fischerella thermalis 111/344/542]|nr:hypothetical protein CA946_03520 [Fischerella thermalis 111/344/542]
MYKIGRFIEDWGLGIWDKGGRGEYEGCEGCEGCDGCEECEGCVDAVAASRKGGVVNNHYCTDAINRVSTH